jgi:hypothetical protein
MNSKNTFFWFVLAAFLFAFIFFFERHLHPPAPGPALILSGLKPGEVTSVQISPAAAFEIRASRTNDSWRLTKPIIYPAQPAAIEILLAALQKLTFATSLSASELREHRTAEADYGFENPQFSILLEAGEQQWQLKVGNKTAPGNQVFLRVIGVEGAFVADADWLRFIPHSADEWRDTALVDAGGSIDWIVLTNAAKVIELRRDATNHLWRMVRPLSARADSERINAVLQQLQGARVSQFVTDDPKADLAAFGLQPADLDLWLGRGTNFVAGVHVGKILTNDSTQIFAQREGWNAVLATAKEPLSPWHGAVNDFRDPYLFELTRPVAEIEVRGSENYTLQQRGANGWAVVGEKYPADAESVQELVKLLAGMRIADFGARLICVHGPAIRTRSSRNFFLVRRGRMKFLFGSLTRILFMAWRWRITTGCLKPAGNFATAVSGASVKRMSPRLRCAKMARRGNSSATGRMNGRSRPDRKASSIRRPLRKLRTGSANLSPPAGLEATSRSRKITDCPRIICQLPSS